MGPYHFARMRALSRIEGIELTVVETSPVDQHGWIRSRSSDSLPVVTLTSESLSPGARQRARHKLAKELRERQPDVVVASGYAEPWSFGVIQAYRSVHPASLAVLWSESTVVDRARIRAKELLKKLFVACFDGALVAGQPHAAYLRRLGMRESDIQILGNCVDNEFYAAKADEIRRQTCADNPCFLPNDFVLFVGRMVPVKNLAALIDAYGIYRRETPGKACELVLVGSGFQESSLKQRAAQSGISGIRFDGLRQPDELPAYYGRARCLILPSVSEPWGLVVNEAMASGLPVLVSRQSGCAAELVQDGANGFTFDALDQQSIVSALHKISSDTIDLRALGARSRTIIDNYTPKLFGERAADHLRYLYERQSRRATNLAQMSRFLLRRTGPAVSTWLHFSEKPALRAEVYGPAYPNNRR